MLVVGEHMAHAVACAVAPQREHDTLAGRLQRIDVSLHRLEHIGVGLGTLRREIAALPGAGVENRRRAFGRRERREAHQPRAVEALAPFGLGQIEPIRRQRLVWRPGAGLGPRRHVLGARLEVIGDLGEALLGGVFGERLEHHRGARQIIEQGVEVIMEQWQPVLHSGIAASFAHGLVEQVVGLGRSEGFHIAGAERPDGLGCELEFGDRHEIQRVELVVAALGLGIEGADQFQGVAEEVEPHRIGDAGREQIDDAAAHGIFAGLAHRRRPGEAVELEPADNAVHRQHVARHGRERLAGDEPARRHPLDDGVDGGEHDRRPLLPLEPGEAGERRHALGDDARMGRGAVIGLAVPGGKLGDRDLGGEECQRAVKLRHSRAVAADRQKAGRGGALLRRHGTGEIGEHEAFGAVRDVGKSQGPAGCQKLGRRARMGSPDVHAGPARWKSRRRRNSAMSYSSGTGRPPDSQA